MKNMDVNQFAIRKGAVHFAKGSLLIPLALLCAMLATNLLASDGGTSNSQAVPKPELSSVASPSNSLPVSSLPVVADLSGGSSNKPPGSASPIAAQSTSPLSGSSIETNAVGEYRPAAEIQVQIDLARSQRREKTPALAIKTLVGILETNAPPDLKRPALFELALATQDANQFVKAQQIFAQYLHLYPEDPSVPDILLRQGLLYRQMGVNTLAISKFYAVMSSALKLKLDNIDYYRKLVLQAQVEIADTFYQDGKYNESADFFSRLLKSSPAELERAQIQFKLVRSLSYLTNHTETIARSQAYLDSYPNSPEVPEVRFVLATTLKKLGRGQDAMKQVLLLLQSQQENVRKDPATWIYWQQRAGNEIANQFYKEGDYLDALAVYQGLAELDKSPAWQLPVWYQEGLIYEQLQQWQKAADSYQAILNRQKELTDATSSPSLASLFEMAAWRKDYIGWLEKARTTNLSFQRSAMSNSAPTLAQ